jgi:hypothetical protein
MKNIETLRVRNWTRFESHRTRHMKNINSFRVPTNLESEGYVDLISHENGPAHFGAWVAILRVVSQCNPRGTLVRGNGSPYTAASLAQMARMPEALFDEAIPQLVEIGWLETIGSGDDAKSADADAGICQEDASLANDMMAESDGTVSERDCDAVPSTKKEEVTNVAAF